VQVALHLVADGLLAHIPHFHQRVPVAVEPVAAQQDVVVPREDVHRQREVALTGAVLRQLGGNRVFRGPRERERERENRERRLVERRTERKRPWSRWC
jgi:hypothetical protein